MITNKQREALRGMFGNHVPSWEEQGKVARANFRQAFADVISETGGDKTQEFMQRLQLDIDADKWPSPALLSDMEANCPGAAKAAVDKYHEITHAQIERDMKELEDRYRELTGTRHVSPEPDVVHHSFKQRVIDTFRSIWRGYDSIHL